MLNKTCDIKININSYISQQLSHGHNQMHLRNNACYVIVIKDVYYFDYHINNS